MVDNFQYHHSECTKPLPRISFSEILTHRHSHTFIVNKDVFVSTGDLFIAALLIILINYQQGNK